MKLSDFLQETKIVIKNGEVEVIKPKLNGEIKFYNLDKKRVELIQNEVVPTIAKEDSKEVVGYKLFSYLVNIENDIDLETFIDMMACPASTIFATVMNVFFDYLDDFLNKREIIAETVEKSEKIMKKLPEKPKTKEDIKKELMNELSSLIENTPENKKRRKEIFQKLADIEE